MPDAVLPFGCHRPNSPLRMGLVVLSDAPKSRPFRSPGRGDPRRGSKGIIDPRRGSGLKAQGCESASYPGKSAAERHSTAKRLCPIDQQNGKCFGSGVAVYLVEAKLQSSSRSVPEGHPKIAQRFSAGLSIRNLQVPKGRPRLCLNREGLRAFKVAAASRR